MAFRIPRVSRTQRRRQNEAVRRCVLVTMEHVERRAKLALGEVPEWVRAARRDLIWALNELGTDPEPENRLDNQADAADNGSITGYPEGSDHANGPTEVSGSMGSGYRIPRSR